MIGRKLNEIARFLGVAAVAAALWIQPFALVAQESDEETASEEEALERLENITEEKAELEEQLQETRQARSLISDELESIDRRVSTLRDRLERAETDLKNKQDRLAILDRSLDNSVSDLGEAQSVFEKRLVEWYKSGTGDLLSSLIAHSGSLSDFVRAVYYTETIIERDQQTIDFIQEQQGLIFDQRQEVETGIEECERLTAEMRQQKAEQQQLMARRQARLSELTQDVAQVQELIEELDAASFEITMLLRASRYEGGTGPQGLIRPIDAAIQSGFGMRRHPILGRMRMHTGVDMPAPYGTEIHASGSGLVVYAGWKRGYGYTVLIDHGAGVATLYAHCSSILVSVGETVERGQVIAKVGSTGLSPGNHVHFEVRIDGEPVDPEYYI